MSSSRPAFVGMALLVAGVAACAPPTSEFPDLVLTGGAIYPLGETDGPVQALAIHGDVIGALGTNRDVLALAGDYSQQMDLEESVVLPGAFDAWIDVVAVGRWAGSPLDLRLASSVEEVQAMVRNAGGGAAQAGWVVGWGWDQNDWPEPLLPGRRALDATGVAAPIALLARHGEVAWLNSAAIERLGLAATADPVGGRILRDTDGEPSGIVVGRAVDLLRAGLGETESANASAWIAEGLRRAAAAGITRVATAPLSGAAIDHLLELELRGVLPTRVDVRLTTEAATANGASLVQRAAASRLVRVVSVGIRLDGPLSARLAALEEPYEGSNERGLLLADESAVAEAARQAAALGLPTHVHASGDQAIAAALAGLGTTPLPGTTIIGFDLPPRGAIETVAAAGIRVAIAPGRFGVDVYTLDRALGPERAARAHAWSDLAAAGIALDIASDAPAFPLRPLAAAAAALTRQNADGYPAGGWNPSAALPRALLARSLSGGAGASRRARLQAGAPADLVVWSEDPLLADGPALRRAEALLTIVAGRVAFSRALVGAEAEGR